MRTNRLFLLRQRRISLWLTIMSILVVAGISASYAQSSSESKQETTLTIVGTLNCSSCDLKAEQGAASQCAIYGCQFSFKTEKVSDAVRKRVQEYEGKTYHILRNDRSKELAHNEHKKHKYEISGKIYDEERVLEVVSFAELK
ncbi:MAG: hypothetical protein ACRDGA_07125 [Bacteroidota bacterium]